MTRSFTRFSLFAALPIAFSVICGGPLQAAEIEITLVEPVTVELVADKAVSQRQTQVAAEILPADAAQTQKVLNLLPPAPPSRIAKPNPQLPARLSACGGSAEMRFPSPSLDSPAFAPQPEQPQPPLGNKGWPWSTSATFGGVKPWVAVTGRKVGNAFEVKTIHGVCKRGNVSEHPSGLALDFMVGNDSRRGDAIASYLMRNAATERVAYLIWRQRIWHAGTPLNAWQPMEDRGSVTANHFDHVHASFAG